MVTEIDSLLFTGNGFSQVQDVFLLCALIYDKKGCTLDVSILATEDGGGTHFRGFRCRRLGSRRRLCAQCSLPFFSHSKRVFFLFCCAR